MLIASLTIDQWPQKEWQIPQQIKQMILLTYSENMDNFSKGVKKKPHIEFDASKELLKDMFSRNKIWWMRLKFSLKVVKQAKAQFSM